MREDYDFSLSTENPYAQALRQGSDKGIVRDVPV